MEIKILTFHNLDTILNKYKVQYRFPYSFRGPNGGDLGTQELMKYIPTLLIGVIWHYS